MGLKPCSEGMGASIFHCSSIKQEVLRWSCTLRAAADHDRRLSSTFASFSAHDMGCFYARSPGELETRTDQTDSENKDAGELTSTQ